MIAFVKGKTEYITENNVVIDCNGIGYSVNISTATASRLKLNEEVKIYTYMAVREDEVSLYGFMNRDELNMFNLLKGVSGVGPKSALSLLSALSPSELALAIMTDDVKAISSGQGIGKKTAQRIALELKDKVTNEQAMPQSTVIPSAVSDSTERNDAIEALTALGFTKSEAVNAVSKVYAVDMTSSQIISNALKLLS